MLSFDIHYCLSPWDLCCIICGGSFGSPEREWPHKYVLYCYRCFISTLSSMMIKSSDYKTPC
jgi:hypothetical protein